jgi:hypothetical protein
LKAAPLRRAFHAALCPPSPSTCTYGSGAFGVHSFGFLSAHLAHHQVFPRVSPAVLANTMARSTAFGPEKIATSHSPSLRMLSTRNSPSCFLQDTSVASVVVASPLPACLLVGDLRAFETPQRMARSTA